jgi:hypothetical protein
MDHPIVGAMSSNWSLPSPLPPTPPPAPLPATPPARRSRRRWWIFGGGGCGAIVLILALVVVVVLINGFNNSPLRQFPTEPGASAVSDNFQVSTGGQNSETQVIDDPNSLTAVETYYQSALDTNGWTVQATDPSLAASGDVWQFSRTGSSAQFGITFVTNGAITEITVQYVAGGPASSPTPTSHVDSSVTALMLTATEASAAVSGALPIGQFTDAEVGGQAGTDQRTFLASDGTVSLVIALYVDSSRAAAATDYPSFMSAGCPPGGQIKSSHPTIGKADKSDEAECVTGGSIEVSFIQGVMICGVSSASTSVTEDLARAESAKITQIPSPWTAPTSGASPSASP